LIERFWSLIFNVDVILRIKHPNPRKMFLFIFKQKVGSLVCGKNNLIGRPKKMCRLCICDEYGTRTLGKPRVILKPTTLWHEIELRTGRWRIGWLIGEHDVSSWVAFSENIETLERLACTVNDALSKYRERRLQAGLFYLVQENKHMTFIVSSYLYGDKNSNFLKYLRRKKRLEHEMKETTQETTAPRADLSDINRVSVVAGILRLCDMRHLFYLLLVFSLAWAIVYM
jgi:hypothetical protein